MLGLMKRDVQKQNRYISLLCNATSNKVRLHQAYVTLADLDYPI